MSLCWRTVVCAVDGSITLRLPTLENCDEMSTGILENGLGPGHELSTLCKYALSKLAGHDHEGMEPSNSAEGGLQTPKSLTPSCDRSSGTDMEHQKEELLRDALYSLIFSGDKVFVEDFLGWCTRNQKKVHCAKYEDDGGLSASREVDQNTLKFVDFRESDFTPLHMAVLANEEEIVKLLLPGGVDAFNLLSMKTKQGWTPLHLCAMCTHEGCRTINALLMEAYQKRKDIDLLDKWFMTPLHYAAWAGNYAAVQEMLKLDEKGVIVKLCAVNLFLQTPLHIAAMELPKTVQTERNSLKQIYLKRYRIALLMVKCLEKRSPKASAVADDITGCIKDPTVEFEGDPEADFVNASDCCSFTPLHWAVRSKSTKILELLALNPKIQPLIEARDMLTPLHIAIKEKLIDCERLLLRNEQVKDHNDRLLHDRQVCVDSANAILVGASLIAGITFGAYLSPPLGLVTYYEYGAYPASPPEDFRAYAAVEKDRSVQAFWIFNCFSFLSAVATVLASSFTVARSTVWEPQEHLGDLVRRNKRWVLLTYFFFLASVFSVLGAFIAVGIGVLPPPLKVRLVSFIIPGLLPFALCSIILSFFSNSPSSIRTIIRNDSKMSKWKLWKRLKHTFCTRSRPKLGGSVQARLDCKRLRESLEDIAKSGNSGTTKYHMKDIRACRKLYHKHQSCDQCRSESIQHIQDLYTRIGEPCLVKREGANGKEFPWYKNQELVQSVRQDL